MTVTSGIALWTIVAPASSSAPAISTVNGMAPNRSSWPERSALSTTRWLSTNVPFALPWSTTAHSSPRRSRRACLRETDPSLTTTSQVGSRPTRALSLLTSMGAAPEVGTRRKAAMKFLLQCGVNVWVAGGDSRFRSLPRQ
jgi:hypothetical protein